MSDSRMKLLALPLFFFASQAMAATFSLEDLTSSTNAGIKTLVQTVAIGTDHRAYMSASPLGSTIGFDIGVDLTLIKVPTGFANSLAMMSGTATTEVPGTLFLPRLNVHNGLPFGIDVGMSYISYQSMARSIGAELKWAFLFGKGPLPAVAVRASGNWDTLWFLKTATYKLDVVVSKNLYLIDPYVGTGLQLWNGELTLPAGLTVPPGLDLKPSGLNPHVYLGAALKLLFIKITGEVDYSTSGVTTYGAKVGFGF
ncbi:MAG: hypothetical protein NDJ90_14095 [Oligoflexia bacterium]|nr:hypothetical protein [Oligoflexia bacterium]